jgi:CheY-like chemotaxis protein
MTLKLLVADDSATIQKMVSLAFGGDDVVIEAVSDGNSALQSLKSFNPDIVLADVFMPGCSGYEVCERMKEDPEFNHIPVILLVGTFEPFDELEAARVRCNGYLVKPFDTSELIQTVQAQVAKQEVSEVSVATDEGPSRKTKLCPPHSSTRGLVTPAAWNSFLGEARILELFDEKTLASAGGNEHALLDAVQASSSKPDLQLSEDFLNAIADKVVRRMSMDVIREIAWEVVPELSESIIRDAMQQRQKSS